MAMIRASPDGRPSSGWRAGCSALLALLAGVPGTTVSRVTIAAGAALAAAAAADYLRVATRVASRHPG